MRNLHGYFSRFSPVIQNRARASVKAHYREIDISVPEFFYLKICALFYYFPFFTNVDLNFTFQVSTHPSSPFFFNLYLQPLSLTSQTLPVTIIIVTANKLILAYFEIVE